MKFFQALFFVFISVSSSAQKEKIPTTDHFTIEGRVKKTMTVTVVDLLPYKTHFIDSIVIRNHLYEKKSTLKKVKGVLLKDILEKTEIDTENPKVLSEYYFTCIASDNYKVVFSWNEIFNSDLGKSVFIIAESDGKPAAVSDNRIALISQYDYTTGRRYVQGLQKIIIERVK